MELQKQNLRKWAGRKGPKVLPEGWLPLFDAFERLGQANFKNEWTGNEHPARSALISSSALEERLRAKWDIAEILPGTTPQTESSKGQPIPFPARHPELVANVAEHADRRRFEATWGLLASLLHSGDIKAKGLGRDGQSVALPRRLWMAEDTDDILCSGKFEDRWVLVKEADIKRVVKKARSKSPRSLGSYSQAKLANWYRKRYKNWPDGTPPPSREKDLEDARAAIGSFISREAMRALRRSAPPSWHKPVKKS